MMVRHLIFNEASLTPALAGMSACQYVLRDVARAIAELVARGIAEKVLRTSKLWHEALSDDGSTVLDALLHLRKQREGRDEAIFLLGMSQKTPITSDFGSDVLERFAGTEPIDCNTALLPLLMCAVSDAISISFPHNAQWDSDLLQFDFSELLADGRIESRSERLDNLAREAHVASVVVRSLDRLSDSCTTRTFWEKRGVICTSLAFGTDVEHQIQLLDEQTFQLVLAKLREIDASVSHWREDAQPLPIWQSHITGESQSTMSNPRLRAARTFRDADGYSAIYEWHARYGGGGRIHFKMDMPERFVEIGYIGPHLPL